MKRYRHADRAMTHLNKVMSAEFQNLSVSLRFDELNVPKVKEEVGQMFSRIGKEVREEYRRIVKRAKKDAEKELAISPVKLSAVALVAMMMGGYNATTKYMYAHEWIRKRDRLVEALMASKNRLDMREALQRTLNLIGLQVAQGADNITDDTRMAVFNLAGVDEVMWITQEDEKVCEECRERDHAIFPIDKVPEKHYRCRCYLRAVRITPAE